MSTRRSTRDWVVDAVLFGLAAGFGLFTAIMRAGGVAPLEPDWLFTLDQVTGALGCAALWLRRRWPAGLAVTLVVASVASELVAGAMLVALFTVAVHRPVRVSVSIFALGIVSAVGYTVLRPDPEMPPDVGIVLGVALESAMLGFGLFIHRHRELVDRARSEALLLAEQAQLRARESVAREMHDVLGHRLSLLSVHAGALEYHRDAAPDDVAKAAAVIRDSARQALQDLREVVGVLRAPEGELPQPTIDDIGTLVDESGQANMRVDYANELAAAVPERIGRTAYRVVQEALTNARKHAPGTEVRVRVGGAPDHGVDIEVVNAAPATPTRPAGHGLVGLAERVALAGGRLDHGRTDDGRWRVAAWLPWPA
jgi:signal transduction histidine kinase